MRVLLAPDKFKGSLSALEVARHLAAGLQASSPEIEVTRHRSPTVATARSTPWFLMASRFGRQQ